MHSDMDQNGSFFMTEGVDEDEEENDFLDRSESSSSKTPKLENGRRRKHLQRPRKSLQEFERMEKILHSQNGFADDDEFDPDVSYKSEICRTRSVDSQGRTESSSGGSAGRRGKSNRSGNESDNLRDNSFRSSMEEQSGSEYEYRGHNGIVSGDDLREEEDAEEVRGISLSDGAPPDEDQDPSSEIIMMKYMEETPRAGSSGMHEKSCLSDRSVGSNTNSNNNIKNSPGRRDRYEDITDGSIKSENMVSLSQEQPPSHLERAFDDDDDATDEQSEFGETVIPAGLEEAIQEAALNVQEFGSDAGDRRHSESSVSLGRFKPVAVNGRKFKKPPSRRSSRDTAMKGRVSSPSGERTVESAFVPYGDTSMNSEGDDAQTKGEAVAFRARTSSRIPALNLAHMTDTEAESDTPRSKEELSSRLTEERKTRRQATNVNHQLQIEYDELLAKYAEAENTIDHLRLGAVVNIRSDPPPNGQISRGQLTPAKRPMAFDIGVPQRGRYSMGESSRKQSDSSPQNATFGGNDRQPIQEHHTQTVIQEMKYSVAHLAQQVPLLERAIDTKQVPVEEQESLFDHLKKAHGELEEDYMQRREEAREQQRWNSVLLDSEDNQFDPERSLEGQIFQVGIQLEDLQEKVEENVRNNPPTMATRSRHSSIRQKSVDEDIPKKAQGGPQGGPQGDPEYSQMLQQYEALKQLPGTPKRDKEIQRLVKEIDNLQMTSKDDGEHGYISERSDWSDTPSKRRQSLKQRKEKGYSSGRDTPSSAHSLEERKATITEEKQTRNPRKIVKPLPAFPRKASDTAIDSGSSHPRSPEHEVDSGFVGSEGSRQSQKQSNIPRSKTTGGSHRLRPESGHTRIEESRLKRAQHHHTPIQELSERGQHSSSQSEGKRRSLPSRKLEPVAVATSEEEEVEGKNRSFERPVRMSRRSATPSRHQSSQHHIVSPLPSKPKLQDFQRRSEPPRVKKPPSSRKTESISSRVTPKTSERDKIRSEIISKRMTEPKSQKSGAGLVDPRLERLRNRRNSDVPSSVSKSVRSEELQALREELADLRQELQSPKNRQRTRRKPPVTEGGYYSSAGEREYMSADEGYTGGTTPDAHERSSLKSDRSAKSERLAELKAEVALLKKDLRDSEAAHRSGVRSTPSATCTPHPRRTYRTDLPQKEKYQSDDPVDRLKASSSVRDSLRETLRKKFIPTSSSRVQVEPSEEYYEDDNSPQLEYSVGRRNLRTRNTYRSKDDDQRHLREHYSHGGGGEVEYEQSRENYRPLSSMEQRPQRHSRMSTAPRETSTPCGHCNGSGVHHHAQIGPDFTHQLQQPPLQQAPTAYVQTSPNQTVYVPAGSPIYHSTPAVMQHAPGTPNVMQAPVLAQVAAGGSLPHQHATLGTVIGNTTTVTPPPQGNVTYAHHPSLVPVTVLSSSPQVHTLPQTVTVSPPQTLSSSNGATIDGARPVYLLPSSKGRYYIRDEPPEVGESDVEEIIYRRTPVRRSGSRKARKVEIHSQVEVEDERELDDSLFAACQMAQRLKQSSEKVLESVQSNLQKSALRRQLEY